MTTQYAPTYPAAQALQEQLRAERPFAEVRIDPAYGIGYNVVAETRCHECGARVDGEPESPNASYGYADEMAEVYLDASTLRANAGGQSVLVDDIPDSAFGPFIVHADPCSRTESAGRPKYTYA